MDWTVQKGIGCIFGKRGSGKTELARFLTRDCPRLVIIDPMEEYTEAKKFTSVYDVYCYLAQYHSRPFRCTFVPIGDDQLVQLDKLLDVIRYVENCVVVLEEADLFATPRSYSSIFSDFVRRGRHYRTGLLAVSRRPQEVSKDLTGQASMVISFQMNEPGMLDYLKKYGSIEPEYVRELTVYQFCCYETEAGGKLKFGRLASGLDEVDWMT